MILTGENRNTGRIISANSHFSEFILHVNCPGIEPSHVTVTKMTFYSLQSVYKRPPLPPQFTINTEGGALCITL